MSTRPARFLHWTLALAALHAASGTPPAARAESDPVQRELRELRRMIEAQDAVIRDLQQQLNTRRPADAPATAPAVAVPKATPAAPPTTPAATVPTAAGAEPGAFTAGYDKGFFLHPRDPKQTPFGLQINGRMQLRYTFFDRDHKTYRDQVQSYKVTNRNDFEIERGRLEFRAFFLDPRLQSYLNLDFDTDDNHDVIAQDYWVNFAFQKAFDLYAGKGMVPGSRDWLNGSTNTRFADRSLATSFFRPDRTVGLWAKGQPLPGWNYHLLVGNGFSSSDLDVDEIDNDFAYSGSTWWDIDGTYGKGYSDLEHHATPAVILGTSFTFGHLSAKDAEGSSYEEEDFLRLSDGTQVIGEGALTPGVTVDRFDIFLWAVDAAVKIRGFSLDGEYFFRWIDDLEGNGPLTTRSFFDHGFFVEGGYFVIARRVELNARTSQILGDYGDRSEYAGGMTWFVNGTHGWKLIVDGTWLDGSPVSNSAADYRIGDDGLLVRTQLQTAF